MRTVTHFVVLVSILSLTPFGAQAQNAIIETIAGGGPQNAPSAGPSVWPTAMAAGPSGGIFVAAQASYLYDARIYRIDSSGSISTIAGTPAYAPFVEGAPATEVGLGLVNALATDATGNLYLSEFGMSVRRLDLATGLISTVAGKGHAGAMGDGIPAIEAYFGDPFGLAFDASGNLYVSDQGKGTVRRVDVATGLITTVAGTGTPGFSGDGGAATSAMLSLPREIAIDAGGNLYIADFGNRRVRKVDAISGVITTVAGSGVQGFGGDGGPAVSAQLHNPSGVAVDGAGNIFLTDWAETGDGPTGGRVRRIDAATGIITLAAGGGAGGFADGIPATQATMVAPLTVDVASDGDILIADHGNDVVGPAPYDARGRRVDASSGLIESLVDGSGTSLGDGGPALGAELHTVWDAAEDAAGNLFITTSDKVVRRIDAATGIITHYAGDNACGQFCGDGGPATQAGLWNPEGVAADPAGNLFIADKGNQRIRRVDAATGIITTYAGDGTAKFGGDHGPATNASLNSPRSVALDAAGNLYIADTANQRIRIVDAQHEKIDTIAGDGTQGFGGDGGQATSASLNNPSDVAVDPAGRLLIADNGNFRIRSVDLATGIITTVAGDGTQGFGGDGGPAILAQIGAVSDVAVDVDGNILVADKGNQRVRLVDSSTGIIGTVAGGSGVGFSGDGGSATLAGLGGIDGLFAEPDGDFLFADSRRIRLVSATSLPTAAGEVPDGDPASEAHLLIDHAPFGQVTLQWGASCAGDDVDYEVYAGTMGNFASHEPWFCGTGGATSVTAVPPAGDSYYLVVPRSYAREGSYGRDSFGVERSAAAAACIPQEAAACQ